MTTPRILRVDASARYQDSYSRALADHLISQFQNHYPDATVVSRDLLQGIPLLNEAMVQAFFTPAENRTDEQRSLLQPSEEMMEELRTTDVLVISTPIYNFSVPGALKAYIDLICRAQETFRFTKEGPVGLLRDRKTYLIVVSGGTPIDSDMDYVTGYLRHVLTFIGIQDIEVIHGDQMRSDTEQRLAAAKQSIEESVKTAVTNGAIASSAQ